MGELTVDLFAPGMTALHRAGAAGLYMTVRALAARNWTPPGWVRWSWDARKVTLGWDGPATTFFDGLAKGSFGVDPKTGMISLAAISALASPAAGWIVHEGMLGTFCQFGPNNGLGSPRIQTFKGESGEDAFAFQYRPIDSSVSSRGRTYPHRDNGGKVIGEAIDRGEVVQIASWMVPGASVRHVAFKETSIEEDAARALALVYAPAGCFFFKLQSRLQQRKAKYALLVPDVQDLESFAEIIQAGSDVLVGDVIKSSGGHAALDLMVRMASRKLLKEADVPSLHVVLLGTVVWNEKQKSRTAIMDVEPKKPAALRTFARIQSRLPAVAVKTKDGLTFLAQSACLELFADNIATGRPFFQGFAELIGDKEIRQYMGTDRKGLSMMIKEDSEVLNSMQVDFVHSCHQALRTCYAEVGKRAKSDGVIPGPRFEKEFERWRMGFSRAKNAEMFREVLTDFWARGARAGSNSSPLKRKWKDILPLLSAEQWRLGRDLALLALASYAPEEREIEGGTQTQTSGDPES